MNKQVKSHQCPTCGAIDDCDIVVSFVEEQKHNCRFCGSTWNDKGLVVSGGGEAK